MSQNQPSSGSLSNDGSGADWANVGVGFGSAFIALLSLGFTIWTYKRQEKKNREAEASQREKDREAEANQQERDRTAEQNQKERDYAAQRALERMRQQTIRLAWYQDTIKAGLEEAHRSFNTLSQIRFQIKESNLTEDEKTRLSTEYGQATSYLRNQLLERIVLIHPPTYDKLVAELDKMNVSINKALFDNSLKLDLPYIYDQHIGENIKEGQQKFFQILYAYQGEE